MAFKAEELTTQILPTGGGLWACPESTVPPKGQPCGNSNKPCGDKSSPPGGPGCGGSAPGPKPKRAGELDRTPLVLLQSQLRNRLAEGPAAARI